MAEKRKTSSSICVKIGAKTAFKIELFPAEQWQDSAQGRYRLRINRRWHDLPEGGPAYLDMIQVGELVASLANGGKPELEPQPDLPRKTRVLVPNGKVLDGVAMYDGTWTGTEPIRAYDGRWWVEVTMFGKGAVMMPVDSLKIVRKQ